MRPTLLLADDSVTIQRVIELTFAGEDVQVVAVGDGREAMARLEAEPPDIVLADIGMPEGDGYEVAAFIKNRPELAHIPVLLLSGAFEPVDEARARDIGCDGVLVKPFEPQMVISRVRELLGPRAPQPAPTGPAPAARPGPAPAEAVSDGMRNAAGAPPVDSLDNYFDRLDAALANFGAPVVWQPPEPPQVLPRVRLTDFPDEESTVEQPDRPSDEPAGAGREGDGTPALSPPSVSLAEAFAALLAAERGDVTAPVSFQVNPLTEDRIDAIVRRVIARMGDDTMRRLVLETAERLVREEIERIKSGAKG